MLPARFPNLLVNGSQGIAVGMATNIPPHNLGEVIDATVHLIDNPEATPDDLMQFVKGPDFPTGALIMGRQGIIDAYRTGKGSIRLRAVAEIEESSGRGGDQIVVTELPYQTSISVDRGHASPSSSQTRAIEGIADVNDESAQGKTRLVIKLKKDAPGARHPQQPLQAHAAADELRREHGGARRRRPPHAQPRAGAAGLHRPPGRGHPPPVRVPARARRRTGPTSSRACSRPLDVIDADHRRSSAASDDRAAARVGAHGRAVRVHRGAGRAHPRHAARPAHPPGPGSTSRRSWPTLRETIAELEAILGDDGELRDGHQERAGRGPGEVRRRAALARSPSTSATSTSRTSSTTRSSSSRCRPRATSRRSPADAFRDAGPRRPRRGRAPSSATRTTSPTSSPPPPTPTCCSSRTSGASTGSRRTRSR